MGLISAADTAMFRADAEGEMRDRCSISGPSSNGPFDPDTGEYSTVPGALRYEGRCKLGAPQRVQDVQSGGRTYVIGAQPLSLPVSPEANDVVVGDVVTILVSPLNPGNVGKVFRVTEAGSGDFSTATRLTVERIEA